MKPIILYAPNTTNFNNNGLGVLDEAITATVTEEKNGIYELQLTYPITGKRFNDIAYSCLIRCLTIPNGLYQTFRIYAISKPINGIIAINAEHVSYQLSYIVADSFTATSAAEAMLKIKQKAMTDCPFDFWTDKQTIGNYKQEVPANIRSRLAGVSGSILDVYGGEYEFDNYTVKLWGQRGANRNVTLRYGKNITDIEQEENISNVYTSIVGYWKNEDAVVKTGVLDCQYASAYPFKRVQSIDFSSEFDSQPTVQQLEAKANSYMTSNNFGVPKVSIKVSFAALWQTEEYKSLAVFERVYLCDTVKIYFEKLGINAQAKVVKTTYNVLLDRYDSIELGEARTNLSGRLASDIGNVDRKLDETKSDLQKAMERAAELITGNKGGHVIFVRDANGKPQEICIMDTEDINTAQKVWRWNLSGLGYSNTGYTPSAMPLAMTMDGAIVANFITVGELNAQVIKAGILTDKAGYNSWNMQTGEFKLSYNTKVKTSGGTEYGVANTQDVSTAKSEAISTAGTNADSKIQNYDTNTLNQQKVFDKLFKTNSGYNQGVTLTNGNLYLSATYIKSGALEVGGNNNMVGSITLKNASNNVLGIWNNTGITMYNGTHAADALVAADITGSWTASGIDVKKGSVRGVALYLGGNSNPGAITVYDGNGTAAANIIGSWGSSGIDIKAGSIRGSSLYLGGNVSPGSITVYNGNGTASGNEIGKWDQGGLVVKKGEIRGSSLYLGGNSSPGVLIVYNENGTSDSNEIGRWTRSGIDIKKGSINGSAITLGGNSNPGSITVYDASGNTIGTWNASGINVVGGTINGAEINGGSVKGSNVYVGGQGGSGLFIYDGTTLIGKWDKTDGLVVWKGTISGTTISGNNISGGKIVGSEIQTASSGARMVMDSSSTLKGMNGDTPYNFIDMMQGRSQTTEMSIGANDHLNIMTPFLGVATSKSASTVQETVRETSKSARRLTNVRKCYLNSTGDPTQDDPYNSGNRLGIKECNVAICDPSTKVVNDYIYCQLPVILVNEAYDEQRVHGMVLSGGTWNPHVETDP